MEMPWSKDLATGSWIKSDKTLPITGRHTWNNSEAIVVGSYLYTLGLDIVNKYYLSPKVSYCIDPVTLEIVDNPDTLMWEAITSGTIPTRFQRDPDNPNLILIQGLTNADGRLVDLDKGTIVNLTKTYPNGIFIKDAIYYSRSSGGWKLFKTSVNVDTGVVGAEELVLSNIPFYSLVDVIKDGEDYLFLYNGRIYRFNLTSKTYTRLYNNDTVGYLENYLGRRGNILFMLNAKLAYNERNISVIGVDISTGSVVSRGKVYMPISVGSNDELQAYGRIGTGGGGGQFFILDNTVTFLFGRGRFSVPNQNYDDYNFEHYKIAGEPLEIRNVYEGGSVEPSIEEFIVTGWTNVLTSEVVRGAKTDREVDSTLSNIETKSFSFIRVLREAKSYIENISSNTQISKIKKKIEALKSFVSPLKGKSHRNVRSVTVVTSTMNNVQVETNLIKKVLLVLKSYADKIKSQILLVLTGSVKKKVTSYMRPLTSTVSKKLSTRPLSTSKPIVTDIETKRTAISKVTGFIRDIVTNVKYRLKTSSVVKAYIEFEELDNVGITVIEAKSDISYEEYKCTITIE